MRRWLTAVAVSLGLLAVPASAASCTTVQDALTSNKASVVVTCVPAGATQIDAAESTAGSGGTTKYGKVIKAEVGTRFTPSTAGYPWAGMIAKNGSAAVGTWAPRLKTVPGGEETRRQELEKQLTAAEANERKLTAELERLQGETTQASNLVQKIQGELNELPPEESQAEREAKEKAEREQAEREAKERAERDAREKEEREKLEEPPAEEFPGEHFYKGVDGGGWGAPGEVNDLKKLGSNPSVRLENPGNTSTYTTNGIHVIYLLNHYNSGGVKSINVASYVKEAEAEVAQNPTDVLEVLNEPGGNWFWGSGAESESNAAAYDKLLKAVHEKIHVPIYGSADGGHAGGNSWLKNMLKADPNVVNYVTAFTVHPYDGSGANPSSTLVHWNAVAETHSLTGKPIAITEYGRPLLASTGDSPRSTESQQANADGAMVAKARSVGWVRDVEIYGYRGDSAPCYAVFKGNDTPRPAVAAIAGA